MRALVFPASRTPVVTLPADQESGKRGDVEFITAGLIGSAADDVTVCPLVGWQPIQLHNGWH